MTNKTLARQIGQAGGKLMRLEQNLGRSKRNLQSATRNRIIGGWVFIRAVVKIGRVRRSIDTITDGVANARAKLAELKAQPSVAE